MSICKTTQGFGANANPAYSSAGQKGHTGVDSSCGFGSKVYALKKGIVYKVLDAGHPARDGSGYWCVSMICLDDSNRWIEWQIGHLSKIYVKPGDIVNPWDFIGEEGNRGLVYSGIIQITKAMQDAGDTRGSHRHYNKKYLTRQTNIENRVYITSWTPSNVQPVIYRDLEGFYYSVDNVENGYSGSVDCAIDIDLGRKMVETHFASPPFVRPMLEQPVTAPLKLKIKFVFNNCGWSTIDQKIDAVVKFFSPKFEIDYVESHTQFHNIPFKRVDSVDGSSGQELHNITAIVDPVWFNNNITTHSLAYDMVIFHVTDADKQGYVTSAGIRNDADQGPVELTIFGGSENDHVYNQGVDMGNSFAFFACHEIAHGIAMMFKIPDTVHQHFYTTNPKAILDEYNFNQYSYIRSILDRISKALSFMFSLIK